MESPIEAASPEKKSLKLVVPAAALAAILLLFFGDLLFFGGERVLSAKGTDTYAQFLHWYDFGFGELKSGHLPLWNPHIYGGAPFLGAFQSALFYPLNWLYLILPLPQAINLGIVLHLFLGGYFLYLWLSGRGLTLSAALLGSLLFIFCGAFFPHIYAGHLPHLGAIAWTPLLLLSIDGLFQRPAPVWLLTGSTAIAMQILAGHPQYVYYTGITVGIYCTLLTITARQRSWKAVGGVAAMYLLALGISCVQWLPGLQAAAESVRSGGLQYRMAAMFSLPPENLLTLLAPGFFGSMDGFPYWGRWYLWEMELFFTVTGLVLAVRGVCALSRQQRTIVLVMAGLLLLLAFGRHTPLHQLLFTYLPGFDLFRCSAKFTMPLLLFTILLAGYGADAWSTGGVSRRAVSSVAAFAAVVALCGCLLLTGPGAAAMTAFIEGVLIPSGESYYGFFPGAVAQFGREAANNAGLGLLLAAFTLLVLAAVLHLSRSTALGGQRLGWLLLLLVLLEGGLFASGFRSSFEAGEAVAPVSAAAMKITGDKDSRVLNQVLPNSAMSTREFDVWGDDPFVTKRYAQFMAYTQGMDPKKATQYLELRQFSPLLRLTRCSAVLSPDGQLTPLEKPLPRFLLVPDWQVVPSADMVLAEMGKADFEPAQKVLLESDPGLQQAGGAKQAGLGTVIVERETTDQVTLNITTGVPAILLVTDAWTPSWRAVSLAGSSQADYQLLPGDYAFRAIPLAAGVHRLRMEYHLPELMYGAWVSAASFALLLGGALYLAGRTKRRPVL